MSLTILSGASAAASFDPYTLAGRLFWFRADSLALADLAAVTTWGDVSGKAISAAQGTGTKQPVHRTNILNGKPVVRFDGGDALVTPTIAWPTQFTIIAVSKATANAADQGICNADDGTGSARIWKMRTEVSLFRAIGYNTTPTAGNDSETDADPTAFKVRTLKRTTGAIQAYVDGVSGGSTAIAGTNNSGSCALRIGASSVDTAEFLTGDIAELIGFDTPLSDTNRQNVEDYLASKYGL